MAHIKPCSICGVLILHFVLFASKINLLSYVLSRITEKYDASAPHIQLGLWLLWIWDAEALCFSLFKTQQTVYCYNKHIILLFP